MSNSTVSPFVGNETVFAPLTNNSASMAAILSVTPVISENMTTAAMPEWEQNDAEHKELNHGALAVVLCCLVGFQTFLVWWEKRHPRLYHLVSCIGLWLVPLMLSIQLAFWRFVTIWMLFSFVNSYVIKRALKRPLDHLTPAIVYKWYSVMYHVSYAVASAGYIILILTFLGITEIFYSITEPVKFAVLLLFYGIYFGLLSRDFVQVCSERMAANMGYYSKDGFPRKQLQESVCAVCGTHVKHRQTSDPASGFRVVNEEAEAESFQLPCKHVFHRNCIKGWCLIGKKDICPYCKEKFDRKQLSRNPWDVQQATYLSLLDLVRYMLVWQPVFYGTLKLVEIFQLLLR